EDIIGRPSPLVLMKQMDHLDEGLRKVLGHAPIAAFGFRDTATQMTTFVGGAPGFVRVDSPTRISFEWPDSNVAPAQGSGVSFAFFVPGKSETLRLNGNVASRLGSVLSIAVQEAYVHCGRAVLRSALWTSGPQHQAAAPLAPMAGDH